MEFVNEILESKSVIRFPDCDPFNHLNNSRYIDYFINAREDHLQRRYEFNIYEYARNTGKSWFVGQNQIVYLKPAKLMETVTIKSTILEWTTSEVLVEMTMSDANAENLKSLLWCRFIHVDIRTGKRESHSAALMEQFDQPKNVQDLPFFEQRVQLVKGK